MTRRFDSTCASVVEPRAPAVPGRVAAMTRRLVAVVDPFSTGALLAPEFDRRGWAAVAVLSSKNIPEAFLRSFHLDHYVDVIDAVDKSTDELVTLLRQHEPAFVVAGSEWGVELADLLSDRLGLPGNSIELSRSRRDKYQMAKRLEEAGVAVAASLESRNVEDILGWADRGGYWPLVVKPIASAGSDSVAFCDNADEVRQAFSNIYQKPDKMGGYNSAVLAQERLIGRQYFVNSVSRDGRHYVHEMWEESRTSIDGRMVYDRQDLLASHGMEQKVLRDYVVSVLDALAIAHGPAHAEVMMTERGPVLIEIGARLEGSVTRQGPEAATGHSQVSLTVDCYTRPASFAAIAATPYQLRRHLRVVCLIAPHDGRIAAAPLDRLRSLPTYLCGSTDRLAGDTQVHRTVDLFTSPGHLYLLSDRPEELDRDYEVIRQLEHHGLYRRDRRAEHREPR